MMYVCNGICVKIQQMVANLLRSLVQAQTGMTCCKFVKQNILGVLKTFSRKISLGCQISLGLAFTDPSTIQ